MIGVPKGMLRLAALKLLSESSMSGTDLAKHISRATGGAWSPGPGSVYLVLGELLKKQLITELPSRGGNERRYIVSGKGKDELSRLSKETGADVRRQAELLAVYSSLAGEPELERKARSFAESLREPSRKA